jgi:hypothetical protein
MTSFSSRRAAPGKTLERKTREHPHFDSVWRFAEEAKRDIDAERVSLKSPRRFLALSDQLAQIDPEACWIDAGVLGEGPRAVPSDSSLSKANEVRVLQVVM